MLELNSKKIFSTPIQFDTLAWGDSIQISRWD